MKKNYKKNKKGNIVTDHPIEAIIMIICFVILIFFLIYLYRINRQTSNLSVCEQALAIRHAINFGLLRGSEIVPLSVCYTEKYCLTSSGKNCDIFGKPQKDNHVENIKVDSKNNDKLRDEVLNEIAEKMYSCKDLVSDSDEKPYFFIPPKYFEDKQVYCAPCSRISLDADTRKKIGYITYGELFKKLNDKKLPDGRSYLEYLYPGWRDWRNSLKLYLELKNIANQKGVSFPEKFEDWKFDMSGEKGIVIIYQLSVIGYWNNFRIAALTVAGAALTATYVGAPVGISIMAAGGYSFWYSSPDQRYEYIAPSVYQYDIDTLKNLGCDSFEFNP